MAKRGILAGLPWWVKWVVVPVVALVVFGGLIVGILQFLVGLLFKVLLFVAVVGAVIFIVRKFMTSSSSSRDDW